MSMAWKYALLALVTVVNVGAQGLMRHAFVQAASGGALTGVAQVMPVLRMPAAWAGLTLQGVGFVLWLVVISRMELTYAFPLAGALFTLLLFCQGHFLLHESITPMRVCGAGLVLVGSLLIGRSA